MPNAPVSINPPSTSSIPLDTATVLVGLSISDADAGVPGEVYIVSLMPAHGTLSLGSDIGITYYPEPIIGTVDLGDLDEDIFSAPPPGSLFIGGTFADINAALATLIFTPEPGYTGPGEIEMIVSDHPEQLGMDTWGPRTNDYEVIALNIGGNQPPAIANLGGDTVAYVEESLPVYVDLDLDALVTDDNANFAGGSLTIAILNRDTSEDVLLFDDTVVMFNENDNGFLDVIVDGVIIGEMALEYGTPADDLSIALNSEATGARIAMVLSAVTYNNLDFVDPTEGTRTIEWTLTDGGDAEAQTTTVQSFITVTDTLEINREALLDLDSTQPGTGVTRSYTEGAAAIQLAPSATTDDPDLLPYNGGFLTIAVDSADAGDQLTLVAGGGVTLEPGSLIGVGAAGIVAGYAGGSNGSPLVITFLPAGSSATVPEHVVDDIIRAIRYRTTSDAPAASRTITVTLNDGGGTEFGGDDTTVRTATVNVTGVNDAPLGIDSDAPDVIEDGALVLSVADILFNDAEAHALSAVVITGVTGGTLYVDTAGDGFDPGDAVAGYPVTVTTAQLGAGRVRFSPTSDLNGEDAATISFRVRDDGGTANGGVNTDPTANVLTIDLTSVNDAPAGADATVTLDEDAVYTFQLSDFGFTDGTDGNGQLGVVITTLPGDGQLLHNGNPITPGELIGASDIATGSLTFRAGPDANGTGFASFTFQVQDDGGTANGGVDTDQTPNTVTINVTAVNDAPVHGGFGNVATIEDNAVSLNGGIAIDPTPSWISDPDSATVSTTLSAVDGSFSVTGSGTAVVTGNGSNSVTVSGTVADVNLAVYYAQYAPAADVNGTRTVTISTTDGIDTTASTLTVTISPSLDNPSGADAMIAVTEDTPYVLHRSDFGFSDPDGNALTMIELTGVPANGQIVDIGGYEVWIDVTGDGIGDLITIAPRRVLAVGDMLEPTLLDAEYYNYVPAADVNGAAADSFTFRVHDDGTAAFTPITIDPSPNTITVNIDAVNDAPVLTVQDTTVSGTEDVDLLFNALNGTGISASDVDDSALTITLTVQHGTLTVLAMGISPIGNGTNSITVTSTWPSLNLALTNLTYRGDLNYEGSDTLSITVSDGDDSDSEDIAITLADDGQIDGTPGDDILLGTLGNDYFDLSQGANDDVDGLDGNDAFYFGAAFTGADTVDGGAGTNDQIGLEGDYTGANALVLGPTTITNVEVIALLAGFDYDITTVDANVPAGGTLKVFATGLGAGDDFTFDGSAETNGSFMVYGGAGTDLITTGGGNDGIYFGPGRFDPLVDRVNGGTGTDDQMALDGDYTLTLDSTSIQNIDVLALLRGKPADLADYDITLDDSLVGVGETFTVWGTPVQTSLIVDGSGETDGHLRIYGGSANDALSGGDGNDWIWGGLGADTLEGGDGADTFHYENAAQSSGANFDTLVGLDALDTIDLPFTVAATGDEQGGALDAASMGATLEATFSGLANHQVGGFLATGGDMAGRVFLVVDADGTAGYQHGSDYLFEVAPLPSGVDLLTLFG